jgi:hypothetical protein
MFVCTCPHSKLKQQNELFVYVSNCAQRYKMKAAEEASAEQAIADWKAAGNLDAWLYINDAGITALPPLPAAVKHLNCYGCSALATLGELPAALLSAVCRHCPALIALPRLPATLLQLNCSDCTVLTKLPPLPATLSLLDCSFSVRLRRLPPFIAAFIAFSSVNAATLIFLRFGKLIVVQKM